MCCERASNRENLAACTASRTAIVMGGGLPSLLDMMLRIRSRIASEKGL